MTPGPAMNVTQHASVRAQQRGIPPLIMEWLLDYGDRAESHGAVRVSFSKRSRKEIEGAAGKTLVSQIGRFLNVSAVVDPRTDQVITVMWKR